MELFNLWIPVVLPVIAIVFAFILSLLAKYLMKSRDFEYQYKLATIDGLTELYNHRYFQDTLKQQIEISRRYKQPVSLIICDIGKANLGYDISFSSLLNSFKVSSDSNFNLFSVDGLLTSMLSISSFTLILTFTMRYIMLKLLIFLSPFCFLCLLTKETSGIFKSFLKSFISLLLIQFIVAIVLLFPFAILKIGSNDIMSKLFIIGSVYALIRSNQFVKEFINGTGISTDFSSGINGIRSLFGK
jgi:hypothetical protein